MDMKTIASLCVGAGLLSACYSTGSRPLPTPMASQQPTVEGAWIDPNGIVSTFQAGSFSTRTTDTNQVLASGSYTVVSDRLVEINMTSHVRNTQQRVNCSLVSPSQLNCTSDKGAQFSLARQSQVPGPMAGPGPGMGAGPGPMPGSGPVPGVYR